MPIPLRIETCGQPWRDLLVTGQCRFIPARFRAQRTIASGRRNVRQVRVCGKIGECWRDEAARRPRDEYALPRQRAEQRINLRGWRVRQYIAHRRRQQALDRLFEIELGFEQGLGVRRAEREVHAIRPANVSELRLALCKAPARVERCLSVGA